jgi:CheY-like chemotaxis protein
MGKTILLVDDNLLFIDIEKDFLQYTHLDILTAKNGIDALALIKSERPNLVFMDLEMPMMDGASCCRAIKSGLFSNTPVVMVSSKDNERNCYAAGCDYFITKPLNRDVFLDAVRRFIPNIDRRAKRLGVNIDCTVNINNTTIPCILNNISMGGAFVATDYFCTPNSIVQINFELPDGTLIDCSGRVAWMNRIEDNQHKGFGVKFSLLTKEALHSLKILINP